ncbi:SAUR-like auxin-responsive protein family, putative [Theobroma cacao]|uniref:SAUR-like auxin-responsive protein family, putative n=1 Tax=Theobroma cacao TaxID=3641 RepID=A0A061ES68_THECC|nr:SAUR-like auxin-responsive protein family, putative [Theobroma cacao]
MAESKRGLMMFRPFFQKLRKGYWVSAFRESPALNHAGFDEDMSVAKTVPDDVKEGFFTVFAVKGKETQRFVIELDQLTNPALLSLLDQAWEEYGFQQKGALSLPCRPHELQAILEHSNKSNAGTESRATCNATILESY